MNTERLHRILLEIQYEYDQDDLIGKLAAMRNHLQQQVSNPQQPAHQTNLVAALDELYKILSETYSNDFSPGWRQIVTEIGGDGLFDISLKERIEKIFTANQITPASALQEINLIVESSEKFKTSIDKIISGFSELNIGSEELEPGECEMGYSIPRLYVENKLSSLNKEISELNFILNHLSEAVTGEKQEFQVKTISSSDYLLYIIISLQVADVLSAALERIINNYKTILEIKVLRNELKTKGVPEKETKGIESHANSIMEQEIKKIAHEIIKEHYKGTDSGRKNELTNGVTISLNKLANRIDLGFNVEIRVEPLPEPQENEKQTKQEQATSKIIESIQDKTKALEFIKTSGEPILQLKESDVAKKKQ